MKRYPGKHIVAGLKIPGGLCAFIAYIFISILFTYPMIFRMNAFPYAGAARIPPGLDIFVHLWGLWWFKHAVVNFINPFWTNYIFYPDGVSLLYVLTNIIWSILAMPLQRFMSLIAINNLFFLASLIFSGMGMFWLARYITGNGWVGFIAGLIFAFAPFNFAHIGHMNAYAVFWLPAFTLFFIKMFNEKGKLNAVWAALAWSGACYTDLNYAVFLAVFALLFLLYQFKYDRIRLLSADYLRRLLLMSFLLFIIVAPYGVPILWDAFSGQVRISNPIQSSINQSADLLSFFVPSFMHPIFGPKVKPFYDHITTFSGHKLGGYTEVTAYAGFTTIFLVILAFRNFGFKKLRLWTFLAFTFFVLTLGPALKINGLVKIPAASLHLDQLASKIEPNLDPLALGMMKKYIGVPLPYLLWHFTPILSGSESAGRLDIMFVLAWAVLSGFGVKAIDEKIRKIKPAFSKAYKVIYLVIIAFILFEYAPCPIKMVECSIPQFYMKIADDPGDYALLELPIFMKESERNPYALSNLKLFGGFYNISTVTAMYNQTVHHRKIINGITCRIHRHIRDFIDNTRVVRLLAYPQEIENGQAVDMSPLEKYKIKYIILHREYFTEKDYAKLTGFLEDKYEKVFEDSELVAYRVFR